MVLIKLLEGEQSWFQLNGFQPTTVASFYQLNETLPEARNAVDYLTERFTEILKMNPWLCGRLVKENIDGKKKIYISFCEEVSNPLEYIFTITDDKLFERKEWRSVWQYFLPHFPKKSGECVDKDEILCKLILVQNAALTEVALVFSLNHALGDGHTLYYLWRMLDKNQNISSMSTEREHYFGDYVKRDTNIPYESTKTSKMLKQFFEILGRGIGRKIRGKSDPKIDMYKVSAEAINKRKAEYNSGDSFVSTNDILNSWLFGKEVCDMDDMMMVVNMRGRLPEVQNNMAGNYELFFPLRVSDIDNPVAFRTKWTKVMNKEQPLDAATAMNGSNNWATFFHQIELDGYTHIFHIPVYDIKVFTSSVAGIPFQPECGMIIFKVNRNDVGILLTLYNDCPEDYFDNCEMLDGKILS